MFAQQKTSAHAPSVAVLEEGRTSPARPTETAPCLTTEMTVTDPGTLAGHPQLKAPGQHATATRRVAQAAHYDHATIVRATSGSVEVSSCPVQT